MVIGGSGEVCNSASEKGSTEKIEQNPIWRYHLPARRHVFDTVLKHGWLSAPCLAATWWKKRSLQPLQYWVHPHRCMLCRGTRTRSHSYKAPPQAPNCGSRHISCILDGYVVSSMSLSLLKIISPPILDSTEVIHTGCMLCRGTRTCSHSYKAPPQAPKRGSRHISRILDGYVVSCLS
jgi:hypothetical protein